MVIVFLKRRVVGGDCVDGHGVKGHMILKD
jgi:hypothetical protein